MEYANLTAIEIAESIRAKKMTCVEITQYYLSQIEKYKDKNAVLEVFYDAISNAKKIDEKVASGEHLGALIGVPILIKDNIMYKGHISSSASKILEHYVAPYTATALSRLLQEGVVVLGRTNMDEFAMGGSCENSAYGPCKNAHNDKYVSGGSSGGSAVAVALDMCAFALGSDTGGSIRQPSSYNGVVGLKPTYGRVSRYGLTAYADSLDTLGPITKNVDDNALILSIMAGKDSKDMTSSPVKVDDYLHSIENSIKGKKIAIIKEVQELVDKTDYAHVYQQIVDFCQEHGAFVTKCSIPEYKSILPTYYTLAMAEASSNLSRIDGIRYGDRGDENETISDIYTSTRTKLFGKEVKRRIMLGNFVLSSTHYNSYYSKAKKVATFMQNKFAEVFDFCDLIFMPTSFGEPFEIGSKVSDPVSMYIEDMFTVTANILGVPAISVPVGTGSHGLPIGLQILSKHFGESEIYNMAKFIMSRGE